MNVGDRIRLSGRPACRTLGVPQDEVGVIVDIDAGHGRTAVLIHFPEVDVYTSALMDDDVEIVRSGSGAAARRRTVD